MHRPRERTRLDVGHRGEYRCNEALHVACAATDQPAVPAAQRERVASPVLAFGRNSVEGAGEAESASLHRADRRMQIGFFPGRIEAQAIGDTVRMEPGCYEFDQAEIGIVADGIEADELRQHLD